MLSESSVVIAYYFNWDTSPVAILLALLGLVVTVECLKMMKNAWLMKSFKDLLGNCGHQNRESTFVTSCNHTICVVCFKSHMESVV